MNEINWLEKARDAYDVSTDFYDVNIRKYVDKAISHFQCKHPSGSKYNTGAYKFRAKNFRPKTRSIIRRNEAAAATALFTSNDLVRISPELEDEESVISAELLQELITYRLSKTIPWFRVAMAAYQDALTTGSVISHQYWDYAEGIEGEVALDKPVIELRPLENVRFSPSADWLDPINDSPYLIDRFPMHVGDVKLAMAKGAWRPLNDEQLKTAAMDQESTRERTKTDKDDSRHVVKEFDTIWIHRNILREDGIDYLFYTVGTDHMLSEPIRLVEEYLHLEEGQRPYIMGSCIVESHRTYPSGLGELMSGLQQEANEIGNQRRDNVSLVLNRRYYARRSASIDYRSLTRNVPGSITLMDDINNDIRSEAPPEVTSSSYHEQDRINMDYDELAGSFSTSSVGSNRRLNETVGGMNLLSEGANAIMEYQLRIFVETWVEPVLRQIVQLEQAYETDVGLLSLMGERRDLWQKYNVEEVTDHMLKNSMTVSVNVGFGATNPQKRIEKINLGMQAVSAFAPTAVPKQQEIIREVFNALGYKSPERFFDLSDEANAQVMQLQQHAAELEQQISSKQAEIESQNQIEQAKLQLQAEVARLDAESKRQALSQDREIAMMRMALERDITLQQLQVRLHIEGREQENKANDSMRKDATTRQANAIKLVKENNKANELNFKATTGKEGI